MENFNKYLGIYTTSGDVQTAINEGTLKKPYVALVDGVLDYNTISPEPLDPTVPLTFEITGDGDIVWKKNDDEDFPIEPLSIEYKLNDGNWATITVDDTPIPVVSGDTIQFRGDNTAYGNEGSFHYFRLSTQFKAKGNIMSLLDSTNFSTLTTLESANEFRGLFFNCTGLTDVSNLILPATTLTFGCYASMFDGCTSLTQAPELPTTTLAQECYSYMFRNCTSLTTAPELPATTLATNCYESMFEGCTSLNYIKCLATDISATFCTTYWVQGVSSTGTFVKAASMSDWPEGDNGIPSGWTVEEE